MGVGEISSHLAVYLLQEETPPNKRQLAFLSVTDDHFQLYLLEGTVLIRCFGFRTLSPGRRQSNVLITGRDCTLCASPGKTAPWSLSQKSPSNPKPKSPKL